MSGELGKASLDLTADTSGLDEGRLSVGRMDDSLDALAAVAKIAEDALAGVKMGAGQSAESRTSAQSILDGVHGISDEARVAARELDNVKLSAGQAAETEIVGDAIDRKLKDITKNANEARRATESVGLTSAGGAVFDEAAGRFRGEGGRFVAGGGASGGGGSDERFRNNNPGAGVGPFGSGYSRIGLLGTAIGAGVLTAPAVGPAIGGLLATLPTLAAGGVGALGTLALAFDGVTKAIGGDKAAFDKLGPSAKQFTLLVRSLSGEFDKLRQVAGASLFPGLTAGLKSALSPGTVAAITKAIQEFGTAIGQAGAMWGRYFGSPEFQSILGPLMQAGAHNFSIIAGAALSLFDALGVLGRAAILLTTWISQSIADGARLADNWLHAKDASGQLAGAMNEAKSSLQLVGGLIVSIGKAVYALGAALYPVAKVAVKDLTDGFNALAGWLTRNQTVIQNIVGGALKDLVAVLKTLGSLIDLVTHGFEKMGPAGKAAEIALAGIGVALALSLGPVSLTITAIVLAAGEIIRHWSTVKTWFSDFGTFMESIFSGAWTAIKGIFDLGVYGVLVQFRLLIAGLKDGLGWIPGIGGKIKAALNDVDGFIESFRTNGLKNLSTAGGKLGSAWGDAFKKNTGAAVTDTWTNLTTGWSGAGLKTVAAGGTAMGTTWGNAFTTATGAAIPTAWGQFNAFQQYTLPSLQSPFGTSTKPGVMDKGTPQPIGPNQGLLQGPPINMALPKKLQDAIDAAQAGHGDLDKANAAAYSYYEQLLKKNPADKQAIYSAETPYVPAGAGGSVFTMPPPFTKNLGPKPKAAPVIPPAASHAEQLASRNAAKARALGNVGETAKRYLDNEVADLTTAANLLKTKYESATGAARTQLFAALTTVRNKITTVRTELKKTISSDRAAELQFAVDQAKDAVASATVGSAAYKKAITAEEAALRAQIKYLDARAKNSKLSLAARTSAINKETADKKALTALLKPLATSSATADANIAEFISDYQAIVQTYAPNAAPLGSPAGGKAETHLHAIKHELRQQTPLLKKAVQGSSVPATADGLRSVDGVTG